MASVLGFGNVAEISAGNAALDVRFGRQSVFPKINGWCELSWKGRIFCATILKLELDKADVRIFDTEIPVSNWQIQTVSITELRPIGLGKHSTLDELIDALKSTNKLTTPTIETALRSIDRAGFCPETPYADAAVEIGHEMCISAPHMHTLVLECCKERLQEAKAILDVGSGSGYLTALFAKLAPHAQVFGVEYYADLVEQSQSKVKEHLAPDLQSRITLCCADGLKGIKDKAPFTIIHVGFMCKEEPRELLEQLSPGGILIVPIGDKVSTLNPKWLAGELYAIEKRMDGSINRHPLFTCSFVPSMQ